MARTTLRLVPPPAEASEIAVGAFDLRLRSGERAAFLHWSQDELLGLAVPYLVEGLRAGDQAVFVSGALPLSTLRRALAGAGLDTWSAEGRLSLTTADELLLGDGGFDPEAAERSLRALAAGAVASGRKRLRLFLEMGFLSAGVPGLDRAPELPARIAAALRGTSSVWIGSFDVSGAVDDRLADALRVHPTVIQHGAIRLNPYYRPWSELRASGPRPPR